MLRMRLEVFLYAIWLATADATAVAGPDNGQALTPPMLWESWRAIGCQVDCINHPDTCLNEPVIKEMIDHLVEDGYLEAGYNYIQIDNCWQAPKRESVGHELVPDPYRFPNGLQPLVRYARSRGVRLGLSNFFGEYDKYDNGLYPGMFSDKHDHSAIDAITFAQWEMDMVKIRGHKFHTKNFAAYGHEMNASGRPMLYYCTMIESMEDADIMAQIRQTCNMWHQNGIYDGFNLGTIWKTIDHYGEKSRIYARYQAPGSWIMPQLLMMDDLLTVEQAKTEMAFMCMWSAPLVIGTDLRTVLPEYKAILLNKHLIAINQDPVENMATLVLKDGNHHVWVKKLTMVNGTRGHSFAVLYFNNRKEKGFTTMAHQLSELLPDTNSSSSSNDDGHIRYEIYDLYDNYRMLMTIDRNDVLALNVQNQGSVRMVQLVPR